MEDYDEDLSENRFFSAVRVHHRAVVQRAAVGGWLLCVPRAQAAPPPPLEQAVVEAHVLVPCQEEPDSRFRTLGGRSVSLQGSVLVVEGQGGGAPRHVRVLFTETFYDEALGRYKAVCVEEALHGVSSLPPLAQVTSLRECVELLWARAGGSRGLARLDALLAGFLAAHPQLEEEESVASLHDLVRGLYCEALQVVVGEEVDQREVGGVLGLALESYLLHGLHGKLIRCLATLRAEEDTRFNRALRGLSDLQPSDLGLGPELTGGLVRATLELSGLGNHTTPLGKLGCLKRAVVQLGREAGPVSSDQLLPALVVVVVRTGLPTWPAQLAFLRLFRFSASVGGGGEHDFYLSSLEAALQHIASGALLGSPCPEADSVLRPGPDSSPEETMIPSLKGADLDPCTRYFECVRQGLVEEVEALLNGEGRPQREEGAMEDKEAHLCHPLCRCERCEAVLHQPQEDPWPSVDSEDPLGRTGLHLACIFGRPAVVDLMVGRGASLEARDQCGATPLHHAAQRGHQNALLLLLHAGADINSLDGEQNTALHLAAMQGHPACVKALLFYAESVGHHLEVNGQNAAQDTPLHLASRWGHLAIVEQLLDRLVALGLPLNLANRRRLTPIECAHNQIIVRAILAARARAANQGAVDRPRARLAGAVAPPPSDTHLEGPARAPQGRRPLGVSRAASVEKMLKAVRVGDERLACFYLGIEDCGPAMTAAAAAAAGTGPHTSPTLCHPLCQCAKCVANAPSGQAGSKGGAYDVAINACDSQGRTALHEAVAAGRQELARLLLRHGADPNAQTLDQRLSPLHLAVRGEDSQLVADLAQHGANLDLADSLGNTALHLSCAAGQSEVTGELLRLGASRGLANLAGRSPSQEAEEHGHWRLVEMLLGKATPQ